MIRDTGKAPRGPDITPEQFIKTLDYFEGNVNFCGQLSDPIYGKYFIELLRICYEKNRKCRVATAANGRSMDWYEKAFLANPNTRWIFGIDGPPHLSFLHRVNQDGEYLFEVMKMGRELGLNIVWQYIIFSYNEDHIDECIKLAKENKIEMIILHSTRGNIPDYLFPRKPEHYVKSDRS